MDFFFMTWRAIWFTSYSKHLWNLGNFSLDKYITIPSKRLPTLQYPWMIILAKTALFSCRLSIEQQKKKNGFRDERCKKVLTLTFSSLSRYKSHGICVSYFGLLNRKSNFEKRDIFFCSYLKGY